MLTTRSFRPAESAACGLRSDPIGSGSLPALSHRAGNRDGRLVTDRLRKVGSPRYASAGGQAADQREKGSGTIQIRTARRAVKNHRDGRSGPCSRITRLSGAITTGMIRIPAGGKPNGRHRGLLSTRQCPEEAPAAFSGLVFQLRTSEDAGSRLTDW
ncbi:hypothetical protein ACTIVE_5040 [Actinomadura verrucosospora]|uniref:Uncharacterized protein n=1 Tax=Actinomadura verrucosospora TaxID=46165 RepID=A0A7D3ZH46_ACTVE|nr:hypothetical protein ACTIVE_5040 [Actinomadura verrucosospora]